MHINIFLTLEQKYFLQIYSDSKSKFLVNTVLLRTGKLTWALLTLWAEQFWLWGFLHTGGYLAVSLVSHH